MIIEYLKKLLFFSGSSEKNESPADIIRESLARRSVYQVKMQHVHGLTDRLNFRPISLTDNVIELETLYHPYDSNALQEEKNLDITIYLLPDATHPPGFINCTAPLLAVVSNTRLRIAMPRHMDRISHNKTDRLQLEPRHVPILAVWCLIKKCDNVRLLKMFNPLILHMPKGHDHDRGLINISSKGACISLDRDAYQQHKKEIKTGRDLLMQMSFPGQEATERHEFLVIASIRYLRPNLVSGRMELGLQYDHYFSATPKPSWNVCDDDGIPGLKWLLQEYKRLYLIEIKKKLSLLCDPESLEGEAGEEPVVPAQRKLESLASMNRAAQGAFNDCMPILCNVKLALQFLASQDGLNGSAAILSGSIQQLDAVTTKLENIQEMTAGDKAAYVTLRLRDLITQAVESFAGIIEASGIAIERHIQDNLPDIQGDPRQLRLVFKNLILNAVEAMQPQGGRLRISAREDAYQNDIVVSVEDTGGGIPSDVRADIFQPYQSIREYPGLGLGLAVSQRIASAHGGRIELFTSLGEGSAFSVRLPVGACLLTANTNETA
jgi:two-component sensor histidine kinase